jgi:hypothetical protein
MLIYILFSSTGASQHLLSKDGLHLSFEGTETIVSSIEQAVTTSTKPVTTKYQPSSWRFQKKMTHSTREPIQRQSHETIHDIRDLPSAPIQNAPHPKMVKTNMCKMSGVT